MGTWSVPWETVETARAFQARMAAPWMASVERRTEPDFGPSRVGDRLQTGPDGELVHLRDGVPLEPIGERTFWDWEAEGLYGLFGNDSLFDDLGAAADELQAPFDVRDRIHEHLVEIVVDLKVGDWITAEQVPAVDLVRAALGMEPMGGSDAMTG